MRLPLETETRLKHCKVERYQFGWVFQGTAAGWRASLPGSGHHRGSAGLAIKWRHEGHYLSVYCVSVQTGRSP